MIQTRWVAARLASAASQRRCSASRRPAIATCRRRSNGSAPSTSSSRARERAARGTRGLCRPFVQRSSRARFPTTCGSQPSRRGRIARDAFCSERYANFESLPPGARRRHVEPSPPRPTRANGVPIFATSRLRGNVDTRLRKLAQGEYDAIVLAMAGLNRLGAAAKHTVPFTVDHDRAGGRSRRARRRDARRRRSFRSKRCAARSTTRAPNCASSANAPRCGTLRAGCSAPIGVHAAFGNGEMAAHGVRAFDDGVVVRGRVAGAVSSLAEAEALGAELASLV